MKRWALVALVFAVLAGTVGCSEDKTFKVVFANRLSAATDIECYVNGSLLGTVAPHTTGEFSWDTRRLQTATGPDPAYTAAVTFAARDRSTGRLSQQISRTVSTDRTEYVEINDASF